MSNPSPNTTDSDSPAAALSPVAAMCVCGHPVSTHRRYGCMNTTESIAICLCDRTPTEAENTALTARVAELEAALKFCHDWLNRYGEHSPVLFGGETELEIVICTALYGEVAS